MVCAPDEAATLAPIADVLLVEAAMLCAAACAVDATDAASVDADVWLAVEESLSQVNIVVSVPVG